MSDAADTKHKDELRVLAHRLLQLADDQDREEARENRSQRRRPATYDYEPGFLRLVARAVARNRKLRNNYFGADLFGEPAWDILLDLFVNAIEGKRVSTTSVCIGADVPTTTGLRYLTLLEERGLVARATSEKDARVTYVSLTKDGMEKMKAFLGGECASSNAPSPLMLAS